MPEILLMGWDSVNEKYVKLQVDANGLVKVDATELFENPPTEDETGKAPNSEWAYDHKENASAHHTKYTNAQAIAAAKTVKLDDFATPDDNTDLDTSNARHGLLKKLIDDATKFLRSDGAWSVPAGNGAVDPETTLDISDDFITGRFAAGSLGVLSWRYSGGITPIELVAYADHPGVVRFATTNSTNSRCYVYHFTTTANQLVATALWELTFIFKLVSIPNVKVFFGAIDNIANAPGNQDRAGFEFDSSSDTYWMMCTGDGAASTRTASDIAIAAETMYKLKVKRTAAGVEFYIDGTLKGTLTTNLPDTNMVYGFSIQTLTAANKQIDMDFFRLYLPGITR